MPDTEVATVLMDNKDGETKTVKDLSPEKEKKEVTSPKKDASTEPDEEIENAVSTEKKEDKDNGLSEIEFVKEARNRVKLYVLCDQRVWDDRGTGHVTCVPVPDQPSVHCIIVRLESNEKNVLESKILMETAYQKQQETLIVWSESDSCDLALSFQEKSGCEEIWAKICEAQGRDPEEGSYDDMEEGEVSDVGQAGTSGSSSARRAARGGTVQLPPCEVSRLPEIELLLSNHTQTPALREKMASAIENENFVPKLCELFRMCEDLDNVEGLHTLFNIAKHLFHLNRNSIIDILFAEENEKDVLGMLEYDPSVTEPRRHREFLFEKTKFNDVLKIEKEELRERIRHANHVQYVQDVCFPAPSIFEENLLSVLNSHLFFCRVEIVGMLLDEKTLKVLFTQLRDPETPVGRRSDLAKFLKEFCSFSQALQNTGTNSRESFFKTLMMNDVLGTIEPCIRSLDHETRTTIVEILLMMVEYNPQTVRDYLLRQAKDRPEDEILLNLLIKHMLTDRDAELSSADQVSQVLRTLLDPDNMVPHKNDRSEFLSFFYKKCMNTLLKPIIDNVQGGKVNKEDYYTSNVCCLVLRLLCFCVEHHAYNMRSCCLTNGLINKVLVLLQCRHHFLALSALKMIRGVVGLKDDFYCRDIVKHGALDKVVDCFLANGPRYNLLNSAIIELFEYVRQEDMKLLIRYTMEKHWPVFKKVKYVKTFQQLRMKYEQLLDNERPDSDRDSERDSDSKLSKEKLIDNEESWFSNDDDEPPSTPTEVIEAIPGPARKQGAEPSYPSVLRSKVDDDDEDSVFTGGASVLKRRSPTTIKIVRPLGSASPSENSSSSSSSSENSRSPSPSSRRSPEDEVSSSQPGSKESSPQAQSTALKTLSEYGDSDSDPDEESPENGEREDDVTSTSGTKRRRTESPPPEGGGVKRPRSESPPLTAVAELKVGGAEGKQGAEHA